MKKSIIAILALLAILTGCDESDCPLTTISVARFDFVDSQTHKPIKLSQGVTVAGIAAIDGIMHVDTLFNQATSYMSLPLSYTHKTTYVMHYTKLMRDTIEVTHRNIPFVSNIECGALMHFQVESLQYTTNALDSVTLVNPQITNEETTNFLIYYHITDTE